MSAKPTTYDELLAEYRYALGIWTETKALYPPEAPEVFQATWHLEDVEHSLQLHREMTAMKEAEHRLTFNTAS